MKHREVNITRGCSPLEPQQIERFETSLYSRETRESQLTTLGRSKGLQPLVTMGTQTMGMQTLEEHE
jgi:hypothetical protein